MKEGEGGKHKEDVKVFRGPGTRPLQKLLSPPVPNPLGRPLLPSSSLPIQTRPDQTRGKGEGVVCGSGPSKDWTSCLLWGTLGFYRGECRRVVGKYRHGGMSGSDGDSAWRLQSRTLVVRVTATSCLHEYSLDNTRTLTKSPERGWESLKFPGLNKTGCRSGEKQVVIGSSPSLR